MADDVKIKVLTTEETLSFFSEWLDGEGITIVPLGDKRSHDDLARAFVEHWEADERRAILCGRAGARFVRSLREAAQKFADALE